ncbi:tRNA(Met) cytidine acetyltransferase TmcA [Salinicola halimionae]|uniref:tRNA(Met) cytidine acetyltransferase TmcA n=1 Tax=Salinicola halimionae TaxID=1949081 RepID=UPI000DA1BB38|nr:GNAT family N-acetyltransferase [Salinicola halimionae]
MPRLTPHADSALTDWLVNRRSGLHHRRWRGVLWIADDALNAIRKAMAWIASTDWQSSLWVGPELPELPESLARLSASRARTQLGSEHDLVVFDAVSAQSGFDPDAFGAISGTVRAGGWLVLLTPKHWLKPTGANWLPDADYRRLAHWPHEAETLTTHYLQRLAGRLRDSAELAVWPDDAALLLSSSTIVSDLSLDPTIDSNIDPTIDPELEPDYYIDERVDDRDCLTRDQAEAVSRLTRMRRRRPVVLIADRGRGKSAALGIAAARRLLQGERRLWITASSVVAVEAVFERLAQLLPDGLRESNRFEVTLDGRDCCVEWLLPEQVTAALTAADIDTQSPPTLFVDEAAAIPAARLIDWLRRFPRIAFATTVHGYEGTGRGFEVRLRDALDRLTPDWKRLTLQTPIRWGAGDPLETLTRDLLCLDAEIAPDEPVSNAMRASVSYEWLDRESLARDEALLNPVFGLLVQAHYRTSPSDLRQLLDGPDVRLLAAFAGEDGEKRVVGLCVVQQEGGFDAELANAIYRGKRRPRGHLLAQSLATHGGFEAAALARWWRIMRIAVHPAVRRRGLGAAMIEQVANAAQDHGLDRLGVSFGAEPSLIHFWRQQGFKTLRVGLTREASSGEPAQMMGRGLTSDAEQAMARVNADHVCQLPDLLASELRDIEPLVAAAWLHEGAVASLPADLPERLGWFAAGGGELALVRPWLRLAWLGWWRQQPMDSVSQVLESDRTDSVSSSGMETQDLEQAPNVAAAVAALFQYRDGALSSRGRREQQGAARRLAATLLAWIAEKNGEQTGESASPQHMVKP